MYSFSEKSHRKSDSSDASWPGSTHRLTFDRTSDQYESVLALSREGADRLVDRSSQFLHQRELDRMNGYAELRCQSFVRGRYCAKKALVSFLGTSDPDEICVDAGVFGQPIVAGVPNVQVSISHTRTLGAAVAFPESHPVSVDVELVSTDSASTIQDVFTSTERENCDALPLSWKTACVLTWSLKEVLSKLLRCGLTAPMQVLEVDAIDADSSSEDRSPEVPRWWRATYSNFGQYQGLARVWEGQIVAFGCPRKSVWSVIPGFNVNA